ncbi:hypothetical protein [uncultured Williamsia sp.]|uniref:hypothetical protein n=1 Tax=uncultured Williamsia sp. TaxID=259311 RepID=UPI00262B1822|nr:hypothetical protein [uncultured Williamsia sp.]
MDLGLWRSRIPVRRPSDGEIVGWTVTDRDDDLVDAVNPVGQPVAHGLEFEQAHDVLVARGLASLSDRCWALMPTPITRDTDLTRPQPDWRWRRVVLTQLDDTQVWVRPAYPSWAERFTEIPLWLPADDILRQDPPATDE